MQNDIPTPALLRGKRRHGRGSLRDRREAPERAQEPLRDRRAVSAGDFILGLHAGHVAFVCPLCQHAVYPVTTLGRAYARARQHIDHAHR